MLLYIDPGSGSLLFQILIAGIVSVLFFFKRIIRKLMFWRKQSNKLNDKFSK
jgi:hypothetical protein